MCRYFPEGARYLGPAEAVLFDLGCRFLSSVGVGEAWAAVVSGNVTHEAIVTRTPLPLNILSSYDDVLRPVHQGLALSVVVPARPTLQCRWHSRPGMAQQRHFCDTYDGFPELCRCEHPLTPPSATLRAPRMALKESIPCVVATSKHPYHLYRVLLQLVQMAGGAQTPFFIRLEGDCPATEDLARLFNIPFRKYYTPVVDKSTQSVTQLISVVTRSAVNDTFTWYPHADKVIFMEDDVLLSPDFLWYFQQTAQLMDDDPTILAVSAHHTYSFPGLGFNPTRLLRGIMPPQWGWMATRRFIQAWAPDYWGDWDYWVMAMARSKGLDIVFPEISRSLHAGSCGTHIDGFLQAMVFSRQSAIRTLTNLTGIDGLFREAYSAEVHSDVARATPLTLTSPSDCGPNLVPIKQDGPFVMFFSDQRERYAILLCLGMYTGDIRGDFEHVQILRIQGHKLYLVECPQSPHCVSVPQHYTAVPHDDHLMEALTALDFFRRSRELRTAFRVRRPSRDFLEEAQLDNVITGYAVTGMDGPTLFLNKGLVMPIETQKVPSGIFGSTSQYDIISESEPSGNAQFQIHDIYSLKNAVKDSEFEKFYEDISDKVKNNDSLHSVVKINHEADVRPMKVFRNQRAISIEAMGPHTYAYYKVCVTSTCVVWDPLLPHQHLPYLLNVAAEKSQTDNISYDVTLEFTVQDFYNNPGLFD
nr:protein O-linked-mannose beta-1,2-N-acetylglucosaminyltransferase 1-like [Cherax quadricarinatus]